MENSNSLPRWKWGRGAIFCSSPKFAMSDFSFIYGKEGIQNTKKRGSSIPQPSTPPLDAAPCIALNKKRGEGWVILLTEGNIAERPLPAPPKAGGTPLPPVDEPIVSKSQNFPPTFLIGYPMFAMEN